ncbi:MAG: patatin-like phospholipase family protein [Bacteroidetes bacterium]|nr:patatin-like phospholipase family protein [Bacteroidota bacterium]
MIKRTTGTKEFGTGVVLSGGGARGYAHLGVLKAMNEAGMSPEIISGTSAGAIAGVLYADGYTPAQILKILGKNSRLDFLKLTVPKDGLLKMSGMIRLLREALRAKTFEELKIPLVVTATNLNLGRIEYFSSGELLWPVVASASIPVIFTPVEMNGYKYVDGGVMDNMPVAPIEKKCRMIIGSYVNEIGESNNFGSLMGIAERSFHLSIIKDLSVKKKKFDIFINPPGLNEFHAFDQAKAADIYRSGYQAAKKALHDYRQLKEGLAV